jgi:hypothetical protein
MIQNISIIAILAFAVNTSADMYDVETPITATTQEYKYDFSESDYGWQAIFADLPVDAKNYRLHSGHTDRYVEWDWIIGSVTSVDIDGSPIQSEGLVPVLGIFEEQIGIGYTLALTGHNYSDDLFMGYKKKIEGLEPNTKYKVKFNIKLLSKYTKSTALVEAPAAVYI